ncbi:MAG: hypothetical protein PHU29_06045, partial [Sulfuricurvum sp.]|nr:hypothetical protein [Sulfuricurvum sp.]
MAEEQEEIIIIEESDAAGVEKTAEAVSEPSNEKPSILKNKRFIIIIASLLTLILAAGGGTWLFFALHGTSKEKQPEEPITVERPHKPKEAIIEPSELENMIQRANYLYTNGNPIEALKLYEKIALYSEAISQYNLGVVQLKEGEYEGALENFKRSIDNHENQCVSAINAAVCCLYLGRETDFNTYIDMAQSYLPQESNAPMYSYYYTLINYYKGRYLEALSALKHPTTSEYQEIQKKLRAKISAMFGSYKDAIDTLENPFQEEDSFSLGLLYA